MVTPARHFTAKTLADRWALHPSTVYRLIEKGDLPCLRIGGAVRVRLEDVEEYERCALSNPESSPSTENPRPSTTSSGQRENEVVVALHERQTPNRPNGSKPA